MERNVLVFDPEKTTQKEAEELATKEGVGEIAAGIPKRFSLDLDIKQLPCVYVETIPDKEPVEPKRDLRDEVDQIKAEMAEKSTCEEITQAINKHVLDSIVDDEMKKWGLGA